MSIGSGKQARQQEIDAAMDEWARQSRIIEGTGKINSTFGQFDQNFYNQQRDGFLNYARPQLDSQYEDAKKQLTFSLDRAGMLDSSARAQKEAELRQLYDTNSRAIADQALSYQNQSKSNVESARSNLIATLNSTGNAEAAASAAINQASALSQPAAYSALGQMFGDFTSGLAQQAALERNQSIYGYGGGRYNTGLFGVSPNVTKVSG